MHDEHSKQSKKWSIHKKQVMNRLRDLGAKSGEFCVCKWIVSTYIGQICAINMLKITKPDTIPAKLTYEGERERERER